MKEQAFSLCDGRQLGYCVVGDGEPVLYFHGTAGSRLEVLLLEDLAFGGGLRLVGVDRCGFGLSSFRSGQSVGGFAGDVACLVRGLGFKRVGVLGWSGGGVFALGFGALFPELVSRMVVVGAPALPFDVAVAHNSGFARFAVKFPWVGLLALMRMRRQVLRANADVDGFLVSKAGKRLLSGLCRADAQFFSDRRWASLLFVSMAEAFRQGNQSVKAVLQEHMLFVKPWDVPLARIPRGKVVVWQGAEDTTCRVDNAFRLARAVPGAQVEVFDGKGHFVMFEFLVKLAGLLRG
ncbi:MAG: alpha/beta hydrolase [Candidatus Bathyarchaeota archaeon]|nr:alpha/beta hydrolase [Candidatus Bathyarchaeota archaeon]